MIFDDAGHQAFVFEDDILVVEIIGGVARKPFFFLDHPVRTGDFL